jgi:hypothetical protein
MGDVVNLNQVRKLRAKARAKSNAIVNRAAHGRTQAEKALIKAKAERDKRTLDQSKRETSDDEGSA